MLVWWDAVQDLLTDRPPGGLYPIPYHRIAEYAERHGMDLDLLKRIVWVVDKYILDREGAKLEAVRKQARSDGRQSNPGSRRRLRS